MKTKKTRRSAPPGKTAESARLSDDFPSAQALLSADYSILSINNFLRELLGLTENPQGSFPDLFTGREESVRKYLDLSNEAGLTLEHRDASGRARHLRILARRQLKKGAKAERIFVIVQDFTHLQESVAYFEQSFDQFMEGTIHLEEAYRTIERQKNEIETINQELTRANVIMRKDLELAEILQKDLLPAVPQREGWSLATHFQPMAGVSGDILDYYDFPDSDNLGVILLDASGHGVSSALITAIARPVFFRAQRRYMDQDLSQAVSSANRMLCDQIGHISNYLTGVSLRLSLDRFTYINAGHPYILIYRKRTGKVHRLPNSAMLLGIDFFRNIALKERQVPIESGDVLLLYTDGLTEGKNAEEEEYGFDRLRKVLARAAPAPDPALIRDVILKDFRSFAVDPDRLNDDMTIIVLRRD